MKNRYALLVTIVSLLIGCASIGKETKSVSWNPEGEQILHGGYEGNLRITNLKTGKRRTVHRTRSPFINSVYWSPDGERLLAITDRTIELFDIEGNEILAIIANPPLEPVSAPIFGPNVIRAEFSPNGRRLALAGWSDGKIQVLDSKTGKIERVFTQISKKVSSVSWNPNGKHIAVGAWDETVRILDTDSGQEVANIQLDIDGWVEVKFSPDGKRLAWHGFGWATWLREFDKKSDRKLAGIEATQSIAWSPDGRKIALLGYGALDIWDLEKSETTSFMLENEMDKVFWSPDGQYIATLSYSSKNVSIWNIQTRINKQINGIPFAFSPDTKFIAIGAEVRAFSRF